MKEVCFREDILPLKNKIFRFVLRIIVDRAEAEDIVQDTLIKVWDRRGEWQNIESLEAFCLTIAKNIAIDHCRLNKRYVGEQVEDVGSEVALDLTPYDNLITKERLELVEKMMSKLPDKQRIMIEMRDIDGKSYKEIASILHISEEQVKVNIFRGRQKLKKQITDIESYGL